MNHVVPQRLSLEHFPEDKDDQQHTNKGHEQVNLVSRNPLPHNTTH
jgi:hypothetical protein